MIRICQLLILTAVSLSIFCITDDGTRPSPPYAPIIDNYYITNYDSKLDTNIETAYLHWIDNSESKTSTISYTLLRYTDTSNTHSIIKNIPASVNFFYDPILPLIADSLRTTTRFIRYKIVPIDSLNRAGDTSVTCTLRLAPAVQLTSPGYSVEDSSNLKKFNWTIHPIQNQVSSSISLFRSDTLIWKSPVNAYFTGGNSRAIEATLPDSLYPLPAATYLWYVSLRIITGSNEPKSFTFRITHVGN